MVSGQWTQGAWMNSRVRSPRERVSRSCTVVILAGDVEESHEEFLSLRCGDDPGGRVPGKDAGDDARMILLGMVRNEIVDAIHLQFIKVCE